MMVKEKRLLLEPSDITHVQINCQMQSEEVVTTEAPARYTSFVHLKLPGFDWDSVSLQPQKLTQPHRRRN